MPRAQELTDSMTGDSKRLKNSEEAAKDSGKSHSTLRFSAAASQFAFTVLVKLELLPTCPSPELRMQKVLYRDLSNLSANRDREDGDKLKCHCAGNQFGASVRDSWRAASSR